MSVTEGFRIVAPDEFEILFEQLSAGADVVAYPSYPGPVRRRLDGTCFGLRLSDDGRPVIDLFNSNLDDDVSVKRIYCDER
jgi:hypothetical protein